MPTMETLAITQSIRVLALEIAELRDEIKACKDTLARMEEDSLNSIGGLAAAVQEMLEQSEDEEDAMSTGSVETVVPEIDTLTNSHANT